MNTELHGFLFLSVLNFYFQCSSSSLLLLSKFVLAARRRVFIGSLYTCSRVWSALGSNGLRVTRSGNQDTKKGAYIPLNLQKHRSYRNYLVRKSGLLTGFL